MSSWRDWPKGAWSHSKFSELRRCTRAFHLKYDQKLTRAGFRPAALEIGDIFHTALENIGNFSLREKFRDLTVDDWEEACRQARLSVKADPRSGVEATRLVGAYRTHYDVQNAGFGDKHTLLGCEKVFLAKELHASLGGFASKADALTRDDDGFQWVWEHKTGGRMPSGTTDEIIRDVRSRPQMKALAFCARDTLGEPVGVMHNLTTKTRMPDFLRIPLVYSEDELSSWAENQTKLEALIPLDIQNCDACAPPVGFRCQFFEHCWGTDEEKELLYKIGRKPKTEEKEE